MKKIYPVILTETTDKKIPYLVYVPDFDICTQGTSLLNALEMAEDVISLAGVDMEDKKKTLPEPTRADNVDITASPWHGESGIISEVITLVVVDFEVYRRKLKTISVRRNVSLPAWLDYEAEKAGVNVSAILQEALREKLAL